MFAGSPSDATRSLFDGIPAAHEVFGEMPGAHKSIMNEMIEGGHTGAGAADDDAGEEEIEETIEVVDADIGKSIGRGSRGDRPLAPIIPSGNLWKTNASLIRGKR
jgi:hypothetical protein